MDGYLKFSDGEVSLGGVTVPGILSSLSIGSEVIFDEPKEEGKPGTTKLPMGWEDSDFSLSLVLVSDKNGTCYDKLKKLVAVFKGTNDKKNPKVFTIANHHISAWGIDHAVFKRLQSSEDNKTDTIKATLAFTEHNPPIQNQAQPPKAGAASGKVEHKTPGTTAKEPELSLKMDVGR
ncbi:hypothetical protein [Desulfoluna spongiiphila]|uniref:hypothetical protein n=1 Tax=Desulfoluna spongiiphila TaxID=419481 RepID=UPI001253020C|nr:hypothetical protein [Desulfoluna spongiiphila]VVS92749.1 consensus disorder prediction [Desulfoluna spongiiphila]